MDFYKPFNVFAYDEREILCEKVRAILTRRAQKLRDFYDLFILDKSGFNAEKLREEIIKKTKACLRYRKYRENFEKNRKSLEITEALQDPFERSLFVKVSTRDFEIFLKDFAVFLKNIMDNM